MTLVKIAKRSVWTQWRQQTPNCSGMWDGIQFTQDVEGPCDYVVVLTGPPQSMVVHCPPEHIWMIQEEPPNEIFGPSHRGQEAYYRIYTSDLSLPTPRYIRSYPVLEWRVNKSYDELMQCAPVEKSRDLSWITSNKVDFEGHKTRMRFLKRIREKVSFDLYGRGFEPIADKWEGLAPYRYSLAIENFRNADYWTEKVTDCFLAWTMPIYYGAERIDEYFPPESMVKIDLKDPNAADKINEIVASQTREQNLDAIAEARQLILNRYQLFPFVAEKIRQHEAEGECTTHIPQDIALKKFELGLQEPTLLMRAKGKVKRILKSWFGDEFDWRIDRV